MSIIYDKCIESYKDGNRLIGPLLGATVLQIIETNLDVEVTSSVTQFEAIKAGYDSFEPDLIFPFMNLMFEVNALGIAPKFSNDEPDFSLPQLSDIAKINILESREVISYLEVLKMMGKELPKSVYKAAYLTAPFTLATIIAGSDWVKKQITDSSPDLPDLVEFCLNIQKQIIDKIMKLDIDAIFLLDPYAGMLEVIDFATCAGKPIEKLTDYIHNFGKDSLLHICGRAAKHLPDMVSTGVDGLSLDSPEMGVEFQKLITQIPENIILIGNINPTGKMQSDKPDLVFAEVQELVLKMRTHPNFILSTGCDLPLETPLANIEMFMKAGRSR